MVKSDIEISYKSLSSFMLFLAGDYNNTKVLKGSIVFSYLGVYGFYSPFTGEACYNSDLSGEIAPFVIAHEIAHQRGVAREGDADFIAYLACVKNANPLVKYSGYVNALRSVGASLYKQIRMTTTGCITFFQIRLRTTSMRRISSMTDMTTL